MKFNEFFEYHRKLYRLLRSQDKNLLSFKGRMHVYILVLSAILLGCTFFLLSFLEVLPSEKNDVANQLEVLLEDYDRSIATSFSKTARHGILLSQRLRTGTGGQERRFCRPFR